MRVKITSDSTCDLSNEIINKYNIKITPLYITYGNESFRDGLDITADDIYSREKENGVIGSTNQG
jgi:fatty acid-binding protein DegV